MLVNLRGGRETCDIPRSMQLAASDWLIFCSRVVKTVYLIYGGAFAFGQAGALAYVGC